MFVHSSLNFAHPNHILAQPKIKEQHRSQVSLKVNIKCLWVGGVSFYYKFILYVCEYDTDYVRYFLFVIMLFVWMYVVYYKYNINLYNLIIRSSSIWLTK